MYCFNKQQQQQKKTEAVLKIFQPISTPWAVMISVNYLLQHNNKINNIYIFIAVAPVFYRQTV